MKTRIRHGLTAVVLIVFCTLAGAFPSFASTDGALDPINGSVISGWAFDAEHPDKTASVVLYVYTDGTTEAKELATVTADQYRNNLTHSAANGRHGFSYQVDWGKMEGTSFIIEAYAETDQGKERLYGAPQYKKAEAAAKASGPASSGSTAAAGNGTRGALLGTFETTAYCSCSTCCPSGDALTYSGTVPKANHTISADISRYPIGTRLMIGDIIYTVEDVGSNVSGNRLDIYFGSHQEALDYGMKMAEVYAVK